MSYEVIARKWRPQQFSDVVGQEHVTRTLENAINTQRIAHAYLFVGPRGVGKTSLARIFAKALNCEKGPTTTPCDTCDTCKSIIAGSSLDVLEIDGASNNGVEQVRDLRDTVRYAPSSGTYKITIIDEVHMLSNAAFNALLKTLEEPPRHAIFIFATTEPQKILATILSRCQRFDLRRISLKEIIGRLSEIAKAEDVAIDEAALIAIARGADGGMRDAQSALDQIISFKGKEISEEDVLSVFGLVSRQAMIGLTDAVISNDIPVIIQTIADLDRHGKDMQRLLNELLIHFRDLLVCMHLERGQEFADLADAEELSRQIKSLDTERALRIVDILFSAESRIRFALSPRTVMETTLIKCARAADAVSLDMILEQIEQLKKKDLSSISPSAIALPSPVEQQTRSETSATYHVSSEDDDDDNEEENLDMPDMPSYGVTPNRRRPDPPPAEPSLPPAAVSDDELGVITAQWYNLVEKAARISPSVRTCLVDTRPISVELDTVMIGVDPEFEDKLDQMKYIRNQRAIQHILKQVLRRPVTVHFKLMSDADLDEYLPSDHPVSEAMWAAEKKQSAMTDEDEHGEDTVPADPTNLEDWIKDPSVKKVMELFNGRIVDVRE